MASLGLGVAMDRAFWRELAPELSVESSGAAALVAAPDWGELAAVMRHEGYVNVPGVLPLEYVNRIGRVIQRLDAQGIPLPFAFVYDELWRAFQEITGFIQALLGPGYLALPDFWVWCVQASEAAAGWGPHRDRARETLSRENDPYSLTVWLPFSDANPLNGCMYVLPAHLDERFKTRVWQGEGNNTIANPQSIRALPAPAGSVLAWNQCVLHWGGRASHLAAGPRISAAFEFQRADRAPFNTPLLDPAVAPPFAQRLALIGKQILQYQHMYPLTAEMAALALALQSAGSDVVAPSRATPQSAAEARTAPRRQPFPSTVVARAKETTGSRSQRQQLTAKYVSRFSCIGGACEDTCCSGWQVTVDEQHYVQLKRRMKGSAVERAQFDEALVANGGPDRTPDRHAFIRMDEQGYCRLLSEEKLCSVQGRYGAEALSDVCALYPRAVTDMPQRRETFGSLSCPEMARRGLLAEDAMDLVPSTTAWDERPPHNRLAQLDTTPYGRHFDAIRGTMLGLLSDRRYPIGARLFFVAYLGNRSAQLFRRDAATLDEAALAAEVERLENPELRQALFEGVAKLTVPGPLALALIAEIAAARRQATGFGALVTAVLCEYGVTFPEEVGTREGFGSPTGATAAATGDITLEEVWQRYEAKKRRWEDAFPERCDLYFENYSKNYWLKEPYTTSDNLLVHAQKQILRVAVMRFLLFSHPDLQNLSDAEPPERRGEALDRAAVQVISRFSRSIEHTPQFLELLQKALVERGMQDFAHTTLFALV